MSTRTALLTAAALVAFAANSLLCRLALGAHEIDAASFTAYRLLSGAVMLTALAWPRRGSATLRAGSWGSALALFAYAAPFSYAYLKIGAGMGALILFAVVQATMLAWGIVRGERPGARTWVGLGLAMGGLVGLTAPGASAPSPVGAAAMAVAGMAWGAYSLRGRVSAADPLGATAGNFARSLPLVVVLVAVSSLRGTSVMSTRGVALAVASGAVASGLGYSVWYAALRGLSSTRAAAVQLLVPILAAVGGIVLMGEAPTLRLALAGSAILVGVLLAIVSRTRPR